jgi:hypothetical protein
MDKIKVKTESLPERCETCHQSDCFDPAQNYCSRCAGFIVPDQNLGNPSENYIAPRDTLEQLDESWYFKRFIPWIDRQPQRFGAAIIIGGAIAGLGCLIWSKDKYGIDMPWYVPVFIVITGLSGAVAGWLLMLLFELCVFIFRYVSARLLPKPGLRTDKR